MPEPDPITAADEADLVALADGRLDPARRDEVLTKVAADPRLAAELERQRAAVTALAAASEVGAPLALRARIDELQRAADAGRRRGRLRLPVRAGGRRSREGRSRSGMGGLLGAGALVAAACVALVLVLGQGGATVDSVLAVATRPPVAVAAIGVPPTPLLQEEIDGVRFPNYAARFGWRPDGVREDEVDGRATRTVFYRRGAQRIAYTVVAGDALPEPTDGRASKLDGVALITVQRGDRTVVTWRRQGRTCILSAQGVPEATLRELASWRGRGKVPF